MLFALYLADLGHDSTKSPEGVHIVQVIKKKLNPLKSSQIKQFKKKIDRSLERSLEISRLLSQSRALFLMLILITDGCMLMCT